MFTKEKLERWIDMLEEYIGIDEGLAKRFEEKPILYDEIIERKSNAKDLKHTLEQIYTTMTSDSSI